MQPVKEIDIQTIQSGIVTVRKDIIVVESPLQIIIVYGDANNRKRESLSVTMRSPGDDINLVTGFLFCEGLIQRASDIESIQSIGDADETSSQLSMVMVKLAAHVVVDMEKQKRNFLSAASCGFCGRTDASIMGQVITTSDNFRIPAQLLYQLPQLLFNTAQDVFARTGGSHAVALVDKAGNIIQSCEDVGRHNAMDKLVGAMLNKNALPLTEHLVLFSGRLSYELVQKSVVACIPVVCAIGAPSSLAIKLAADNGITLIGFLKNNSFNIYCWEERVIQQGG